MKKNLLIISVIIIFAGAASYAVFAADQMRMTEIFIYSSDTAVSSAVNPAFTLYIGDNLSGITNPVKSLYFVASGVYTGNGTINFKIDSDGATTQTFTLPDVSTTPTPFELIYKDPSGKINPTSAGSYGYTLNVTPSGVTLYGLGIRMKETHKYAPPSCDDGDTANEKIKSTNSFIYSSDTAVSSAVNPAFTLYIGDNLSGITNPVKSLYFVASGVYTGNGTINFKIDSDGATTQTFTLPDVSTTPTPFELIYKDPSGKISPTSAGSYGYTLNVTPSGVTLYGLGIKLSESHRYKPPACGGVPYGDLISAVFDSGVADGAAYNSILWKGTIGTGNVKFQFATADNTGGPWTYYGSSCIGGSGDWFIASVADTPVELLCPAQFNNKQYYRYKIRICSASNCTDVGATSPIVEDVVVSWAP